MYAVIKSGGKQYKVAKDDVITVEKLPFEKGKKVNITEVLLISEKGKPVVGNPLVKGASVDAEIVDQIRGKKITVFKKKRRKNYRRKIGHKQNLTSIKITEINTKKTKTAEKKVTESASKTRTETSTKEKESPVKKKTAEKKVKEKKKTATTKKKTSVKTTSKGKKE
ncbi:MAG: 50S ribosomal protein L21 [Pseudomonadota bacterium]|nr:50S ribosomal protein L21 [Pseudomonadota bacterium]